MPSPVSRRSWVPTQMAMFLGHLEEEPPDPCWQRADLPAPFGPALITALAKDPAARPAERSGLCRRAGGVSCGLTILYDAAE